MRSWMCFIAHRGTRRSQTRRGNGKRRSRSFRGIDGRFECGRFCEQALVIQIRFSDCPMCCAIGGGRLQIESKRAPAYQAGRVCVVDLRRTFRRAACARARNAGAEFQQFQSSICERSRPLQRYNRPRLRSMPQATRTRGILIFGQ